MDWLAELIANPAEFALSHWKIIFAGVGGTGFIGVAGNQALGRLRADKAACQEVLGNAARACDAVSSIVGRPGTVDTDCDHCRSSDIYRRKVGEGLSDIFPAGKYKEISDLLKRFGAAARDLEDAVMSDPPVPQGQIRAKCDAAVSLMSEIAARSRGRFRGRLSYFVLGKHPERSAEKAPK